MHQPDLTTIATLTHALAKTIRDVLAWLPTIPNRRATPRQLTTYCQSLRHRLAHLRRHHKAAWERFAEVAGREGFLVWDGDRTESAHQAVATLGQWLYKLLGGRAVARGSSGAIAPARLLRLELGLPGLANVALPGFHTSSPSLPPGLFQALAWELRAAVAATEATPAWGVTETAPRPETRQGLDPVTEWEKLGPQRQEMFRSLHKLRKSQASAKEILGHAPSKGEQTHLGQLVEMGIFGKPGGKQGRGKKGYTIRRVPVGYPNK
jgi:hypothetical protein